MIRRFFEAYPNTTLLNYDNASYPYWKCGIPPENSMNLVRAYDDGSLPWPGIMFGLTISSVWYWCSDQVSTPSCGMIERGGSFSQNGCQTKRDHYSLSGRCSGGWDFFLPSDIKNVYLLIVFCFIIIHVYLTIISETTMEFISNTVSFHYKLKKQFTFPKIDHDKYLAKYITNREVSKKYHST